MTTGDVLIVLRRHGTALALLLGFGLLASGIFFAAQPRSYEASATIFISTTTGDEVSDLQVGTSISEQRAVTYAELVNSPAVLDPVMGQLGLSVSTATLGNLIQARVIPGTSLLEITAESATPQGAAELVEAVSESLTELSGALEEIEGSPQGLVTLSILDTVSLPEQPAGPGLLVYLALGGAAGLGLGVGWILLRHSLDTRIHSAAEVAELTDLPVITAPQDTKGLRRSRSTASYRREAFTALEAHLRLTSDNEGRAVIVTSPVSGEETTRAVLDLAAASVSAGRRTIVVDADPRRSRMTRQLDLSDRLGLADVLAGSVDSEQVVVRRPSSFDAIPAGYSRASSNTEGELKQVLSHLNNNYELTILDAPAVLPGTEAIRAGQVVGGTLVVARAGATDRGQLMTTLERLRSSGTSTIGVLLLQPRRGPDSYKPGHFRWVPARTHQVAA